MNFSIREACGSDAKEMLVYTRSVGGETDFLSYGKDTFNIGEEKEARFLERFKNSKKCIMLIVLEGEKIVGSASIESNRTARYSHRAELSITVLKDYWGKGVGSAMMEELLDFCRKSEIDSVHLEVRSDNLRAIALYTKFGFKQIGKYERYFKINGKFFDADFMVLYL